MALPQNTKFGPVMTQEKDYGSEMGILRRAPASTVGHPLEASELSYHKRQEDLRLSSATKAFGIGFALHLRHERAAAGCPEIGHLGFLSKSNAHIQALTGRDLELDFTDTLGIEPEMMPNPHMFMETVQKNSCFRM